MLDDYYRKSEWNANLMISDDPIRVMQVTLKVKNEEL